MHLSKSVTSSLIGVVVNRYFLGSKVGLDYYGYRGLNLIGGSNKGNYRLFHFNHTELMLVIL